MNLNACSKTQAVEEPKKVWFVYMIKSSDNKLYTGITLDMLRRWKEHTSHTKHHLAGGISSNCLDDKSGNNSSALNKAKGARSKGAKFFRGRSPDNLVFLMVVDSRSEASKKESAIKKLSRVNKIALINSSKNEIGAYTELQALLGCSSERSKRIN